MKTKQSKRRAKTESVRWDILCEPAVLEKLKKEETFWQIIALSRAVNTLSFAHWSVLPFWKDPTLQGLRTRNNLFLYTCAALSEGLLLIDKMFLNFNAQPEFANLQAVLKTKTAKRLRNLHLERVRNHMVFHFLPESFGKMVNIQGESHCSFVQGYGNDQVQRYYDFADTLAVEFFVGRAAYGSEEFYKDLEQLMIGTRQLTADFVGAAENLIKHTLARWGFQIRPRPISKELAAWKRKIAKMATEARNWQPVAEKPTE